MTQKLLTVRIDEDLLEQFKKKTKEKEQSMSAVLKDFMRQYLDNSADQNSENSIDNDSIDTSTDTSIDNALETKLDKGLEDCIDAKIDNYLDTHLENCIDIKIEQKLLEAGLITQQQLQERLAALWDSLLDVIENKGKERDRSGSKDSKHKQLNLMDSFPTPNLEQTPIVTDKESTIDSVEETPIDSVEETPIDSEDEILEDLSKNTPSETTLEDTKDTYQDESHLKPPETLESQFPEKILVVKARDSQQERDLSGGKSAKNLSSGKRAKKSPEEKGISVEAIAKQEQVSITAPTIRTILKGGGSADSRQTYQLEVERYYTWDSDKSRFFPKH